MWLCPKSTPNRRVVHHFPSETGSNLEVYGFFRHIHTHWGKLTKRFGKQPWLPARNMIYFHGGFSTFTICESLQECVYIYMYISDRRRLHRVYRYIYICVCVCSDVYVICNPLFTCCPHYVLSIYIYIFIICRPTYTIDHHRPKWAPGPWRAI